VLNQVVNLEVKFKLNLYLIENADIKLIIPKYELHVPSAANINDLVC